MNAPRKLHSLGRLVEHKRREVDKLAAAVAGKEAVRQRYLTNLARLDSLRDEAGPSGVVSLALSQNCADYKQAVMALAASHRDDLALHEADLAVARRALADAARRREVLDQVRVRAREAIEDERTARERKRQDELASLTWLRNRA